MAIGDNYRMAVIGTGPQSQQLVNVFVFQQAGTRVAASDVEDLVAMWQEQLQALFLGCFNQSNIVTQYQVRGITTPTEGLDFVLSPPLPGGVGGDGLPPQSATLVSWRTSLIGRSYRGRTYLWPTSEAQQVNGVISAAQITAVEAWVDKMNALPAGSTHGAWTFGIYSTTLDQFTPVTSGAVRVNVATQRRRRPGSGS